MAGNLITTKQLMGKKVVDGKNGKRIGKVRHFVFHPTERRCIGFLVKRPDAALMFHRKDLFVALNGFDVEDGQVVVRDEAEATDRKAIRALGVDWESCVLWVGMPVMTESSDFLGYVDTVTFDRETGEVSRFTTESGVANDAILGKRTISAKMLKGFRRGVGTMPLTSTEGTAEDNELAETGAILVSDEAAVVSSEGGVAEAAGKATAVVADKAKKRVVKVKPKAKQAAKTAGDAVNAGAFAAGKQLGKASGMFAAFKEEYDKAVRGDDEG